MTKRTWSVIPREFVLSTEEPEGFTLTVNGTEVLRGSAEELAALAKHARALTRRTPRNAGQRWSHESDTALRVAFEAGVGVSELAKQLERSGAAVRARLVHLGLLEDDGSWRRFTRPSA
ncbi:MAG: hypothetical protein R3F61_10400 [Myxococcota bacterium]